MTGFFVNDFVHYFQKTVSISWNRVCRYFFAKQRLKYSLVSTEPFPGFFTPAVWSHISQSRIFTRLTVH